MYACAPARARRARAGGGNLRHAHNFFNPMPHKALSTLSAARMYGSLRTNATVRPGVTRPRYGRGKGTPDGLPPVRVLRHRPRRRTPRLPHRRPRPRPQAATRTPLVLLPQPPDPFPRAGPGRPARFALLLARLVPPGPGARPPRPHHRAHRPAPGRPRRAPPRG